MRIAIIIGGLNGGGAERVASIISNRLHDAGNEVFIIVIASKKIIYEVHSDIKIISCTEKSKIRGAGFIKRVKDIRNQIKEISPDVCISFTVSVNLYSVLANMGLVSKMVLAERNDPRFDPANQIERLMRTLLYRFADGYIFQTEGERKFFSKKIQDNSSVIYNPLNPKIPEAYTGIRRKTFVSVGRLVQQKRMDLAIEAFTKACKDNKDFTLEIYGEGPLRRDLEKQIYDVGMSDRIFLCGAHTDIYEKIKDAYGFILSSDYEGISNAMIEAMALGIPTISTDYPSGGAREFIEDKKNGLLIPTGSAEDLKNAILYLVNNPEEADNIGRNGVKVRVIVEMSNIINQWEEYVNALVHQDE